MHAPIGRGARVVIGAVIAISSLGIAHASATSITDPKGSPVVAPLDSNGHLAPISVSASGFMFRTAVYVEQCDGTSPSAPGWDPTANCDLGTSPAAVYADANGNVTFSVTDSSHAFVPFVGASPQLLFNCVPSGTAAPNNGLESFTNCQVRVSSNNSMATADQQFFGLRLPSNATNRPRSHGTTTTTMFTARSTPVKARVTTTTRAPGVSSNKRSTAKTAGPKPASGSRTSPPGAVAAAQSAEPARSTGSPDSPGLLGVSDPSVAVGYLVLLLGAAITALAVRRARRNPARRSSRTERTS